MAWFMRGVQSAIFHYVSCAPCTGYLDRKHRRKQAKEARKIRTKLQLEHPELYHHPEPTGTNPYWQEEITMGPGPPPRRARRNGSSRAITTAGTQSSAMSQVGNSFDVNRGDDLRLSDDTLDDDNWNHKRYQREDEDLWGSEHAVHLHTTTSSSSVVVAGLARPSMSRSESYYAARAPPVNDLHPPVVSLPSPHPTDNQWMLQPPPKASIMSGKERARNRSRSGSGASSRLEVSLQRQVSARHLSRRLELGETPGKTMSRGSSYSNLVSGQRNDRPKTPQPRPISSASSRRKRRDTAMTKTDTIDHSSGESSDAIEKRNRSLKSQNASSTKASRQQLSTVISSGSGDLTPSKIQDASSDDHASIEKENVLPELSALASRRTKNHSSLQQRPALSLAEDRKSLDILQDLVSTRALLNTRFVSAPLIEARIKLPQPDAEEEKTLSANDWAALSKIWGEGMMDGEARVPFDSHVVEVERDPKMRWSVDF